MQQRTAYRKDTFRLILKTKNRFLSVLCIVLIGVAFMMGLLTSMPSMKKSVDLYDDEYDLQDIQIYSSYGFCQEDVDAVTELEGVENVFASRFVDAYVTNNKSSVVCARFRELDSTVNRFKLTEGEMPAKANECLVLSGSTNSTFTIGDKITVYREEEGEIDDYLARTDYTITGIVESPEYMSKISSTGTYKNKDISLVFYIPNENFISEYYTSLFLTITGAKDYNGLTDQYDDFISSYTDDLSSLAIKQQDYLKEKLLKEYQEKIDSGEEELEQAKSTGQAELDAAKSKLDNANIQIISSETTLSILKEALSKAETELAAKKSSYQASAAEIEQIMPLSEVSDFYARVAAYYGLYTILQGQADGTDTGSMVQTLQTMIAENNSSIEAIDRRLAVSDPDSASYDPTDSQYSAALDSSLPDYDAAAAESYRSSLQTEQQNLRNSNTILEQELANAQSGQSAASASALMEELDAQAVALADSYHIEGITGVASLYSKAVDLAGKELEAQVMQEALDKIQSYVNQLKSEITSSESSLTQAKTEYADGLNQYQEGLETYNREIEKAETDLAKAKQDLEELPDAQWTILDRDSHYSSAMFRASSDQMNSIGICLPVLFFMVAALVCMTTMTRLIDEQRGQIGIYLALGYSKFSIIQKYLIYALTASLIGAGIGVVVGVALFPPVIYDAWGIMYVLPEMKIQITFPRLTASICSFTVLMLVVTFVVVRNTMKSCPSQLMRPKPPKGAKKILLEKVHFIWSKLSFTSKITVRNLVRYKARFFMTLIGVAGCTSLLVLGFGIRDSISDIVNIQYGDIFSYNYIITMEDDTQTADVMDMLGEDMDNNRMIGYTEYTSTVYLDDDDETINVICGDNRDLMDMFHLYELKSDNTLKLTNSGVIISDKFADTNHLSVGDTITIESEDGIKAEVEIAGICKMYFQHYLFMSEALYSSVFGQMPHYKTIALNSDADSKTLEGEMASYDTFVSLSDFSKSVAQFQTMLDALDIIILVIVVAAGSLALVVLFNLTQVNISERTREIATLKVLGFRPREIQNYIYKEIIILTLLGAIVGFPLGKLELGFVMNVIDMAMVRFPTSIKLPSYCYSAAITFGFTFIILLICRKPLRDIQMVESLKSVE